MGLWRRRGVAGTRPARDATATRYRAAAVALVGGLIVSMAVLGEPSRPATATVERPIVTVQALCTVPTIIDVAAGEATRGLSGVGDLLGTDEPRIGEAARDVAIVDTGGETFFVAMDGGELRIAALAFTGLPVLAPAVGDGPPRTFRVFSLGEDLAQREPLVVAGDDGVYVVFGGDDDPVSVFWLDRDAIASPLADLSGSQDPNGPTISAPGAQPGAAVVHDGVLWLASDDGVLWAHDRAVETGGRWTSVADGLVGPLIARDDDAVVGIFPSDDFGMELRTYVSTEAPRSVQRLDEPALAVEAVTYPSSRHPAFLVRGASDGDEQAGVLRPGTASSVVWTSMDALAAPAVGLVATGSTTAVLVDLDDRLTYIVLDAAGVAGGAFPDPAVHDDCTTVTGWPDAAGTVSPLSAGSMLHLHDPASPYDCVVDTRQRLDRLEERCAPGGEWSVDKGDAPESDFSVEFGRALEEHTEDEEERERSEEEERAEATDPAEQQQFQEEIAEAGLGITEVDDELTDLCAEEVVDHVAPPDLNGVEPVGDRTIRADWSWSGGQCLPERYVVETCVMASDGSGCGDRREFEVEGHGSGSNRFATEVAARPDRTYRVAVRAVKGRAVSELSNHLLVTMPAAVPAAPTGVSASLSGGTWTVSWRSCLDDGDCDQRPDGFIVTVEGCDGDSLAPRRHVVGASERRVSYDLDGSGFPDADLLGRKVRFRVAATAAGYTSDSVPAGACQESVRAGRTVAIGDAGITLGLSGRTTSMTLEGPSRGPSLTRLLGVSSYDDVAARLIRQSTSTASRSGALGGSVTFEVDRCSLDGWTVELTPRRGGQDLTAHRARITGVPAACGWAVTDSTAVRARVTGGDAASFSGRVTIPGLSEDVRNGKVERVTASMTCRLALGGSAESTLSTGAIDGDVVPLSGPTPAVFDLAGGCTVRATVAGTEGATVVPPRADLDLRPASAGVVDKVGPLVVDALRRSMTGSYEGLRALPIHVLQPDAHVAVRFAGSGIPCTATHGSSDWTFRVTGGRSSAVECEGSSRTLRFYRDHLDGNRGDITYRITLAGTGDFGQVVDTNVCALPSGERAQPCTAPADPCPWDDDIPASDPGCFEPCEWDDDIPADDPRCVEPVEDCEWDPSIPADDPDCVEPPECEWDPSIPADDPECVEPPDPGEPDPGGQAP